MAALPGPAASAVLRRCDRALVLVIGDSHSAVFSALGHKHFGNLNIVTLRFAGASAQGLANPNSRSDARNRIAALLRQRAASAAAIIFLFGAVDFDFVVYHKSIVERAPRTLAEQIALSSAALRSFLTDVVLTNGALPRSVYLAALHPPPLNADQLTRMLLNPNADRAEFQALREVRALPDDVVLPDHLERTAAVREFNACLHEIAGALSLGGVLDVFEPLIDPETGLVRASCRRERDTDVHLETEALIPHYVSEMTRLGFDRLVKSTDGCADLEGRPQEPRAALLEVDPATLSPPPSVERKACLTLG